MASTATSSSTSPRVPTAERTARSVRSYPASSTSTHLRRNSDALRIGGLAVSHLRSARRREYDARGQQLMSVRIEVGILARVLGAALDVHRVTAELRGLLAQALDHVVRALPVEALLLLDLQQSHVDVRLRWRRARDHLH